MKKNFTKMLLLVLLFVPGILQAQSSLVYIYSEDFETPDAAFLNLNTNGKGANSGPNKWIINNRYNGQPTYPNTISQDSTYSGSINHPDSNYLHIYDSGTSGVSNANFNPSSTSDRFTEVGPFCTVGLKDIHFAFYHLCEGNANSFGELYFKGDTGTWTKVPGATYQNISKWKYADINNAAFGNVNNLRFGFRWTNDNSGSSPSASFAVDDISIIGTYDPDQYKVEISIDTIKGVPACQNTSISVYYTFSLPLCGVGKYKVEMSDATGDFTNATILSSSQLAYNSGSSSFDVTIPSTTPAGTCYKIRITRSDIIPEIVSEISACFEVKVCPNTITTKTPPMLSIAQDTICLGSVLDVSFLSYGVYLPGNTYIAQLSDSDGNFTNPLEIGTLSSYQTYDDPLAPGTVFGLLLDNNHTLPAGCNYKVRIVTTSPVATGTIIGPFCIRHCDIETNETHDIHACVSPTVGKDTILPVALHILDSTAIYSPTNTFQVQVLNSKTFAVINTGGLGSIVSDSTTKLNLQIPGLNGLQLIGMKAGFYYLRVVASNSNEPWNLSGTLVRLYIGSPNPSPPDILGVDLNTFNTYPILDTIEICVASQTNLGILLYQVDPYNNTSQYEWTLNGTTYPGEGDLFGATFTQGGIYNLTVVENSFGCYGPPSDSIYVKVKPRPSVFISGPVEACVGDTVEYSVKLVDNTYYSWSTNFGSIVDSAANTVSIKYDQAGSAKVTVTAVGECGPPPPPGIKNTTIKDNPVISASASDTFVCPEDSVQLQVSTNSGTFNYLWNTGETTKNIIVTPDTTTIYVIKTSITTPAKCYALDTVIIQVKETVVTQFNDSICPKQPYVLDAGITNATFYNWSTGATTQTISVNDEGIYTLSFKEDTAMCKAENIYDISLTYPGSGMPVDESVCPGQELVLNATGTGTSFYWSTNATNPSISVNDTGTYSVSIINQNGECIEWRLYNVKSENCQLHFPNVITPNEDNLNDYWSNTDQSDFDDFNVQIVDRWGGLVFESSDSQFKWNGRNKSDKLVADGVYFYTVTAGSGSSKQVAHGFVTVLAGKK